MDSVDSPTVSEFPDAAQVGYLHPDGDFPSPVWLNVSLPVGIPARLSRKASEAALETAQRTFSAPPLERPMSKAHMAHASHHPASHPVRLRCEPDSVQPSA